MRRCLYEQDGTSVRVSERENLVAKECEKL